MTEEYLSELAEDMAKVTAAYLPRALTPDSVCLPEVHRKGVSNSLTAGQILARSSRVNTEQLFHCDASFGAAVVSEQLRGFSSTELCDASDEDLRDLQVANKREARMLQRASGGNEKNSEDELEGNDSDATDDGTGDDEEAEPEEIGRTLSVPVHSRLEAVYKEAAEKGIDLLFAALGGDESTQVSGVSYFVPNLLTRSRLASKVTGSRA